MPLSESDDACPLVALGGRPEGEAQHEVDRNTGFQLSTWFVDFVLGNAVESLQPRAKPSAEQM